MMYQWYKNCLSLNLPLSKLWVATLRLNKPYPKLHLETRHNLLNHKLPFNNELNDLLIIRLDKQILGKEQQQRTRGHPITQTYYGYPYSLTVDLSPREDISSQKQCNSTSPLCEKIFPRNSCNSTSPSRDILFSQQLQLALPSQSSRQQFELMKRYQVFLS